MSKTLIIAGSGPSAVNYEWPDGIDIMAVSSGYRHVPRMEHFVTLDKVMCFPEWVTDSTRWQKHVPDWKNEPEWRICPRVSTWLYGTGEHPNFANQTRPLASGLLKKSNVDDTWHNSLLFAVQIAGCLGYKRCIFIGVDLLGEMVKVSDYLHSWYPHAREAGIEWVNASPLSSLSEWMPFAEQAELLEVK